MDQNWAPCWLPLRCSGCRYNLLIQWTHSHLRDIFLLWLRYAIGAWRIPDKKAWILLELLGHNIPEGISTDFELFLFPHGTVWCITGVYLCKLWYQYLLSIYIDNINSSVKSLVLLLCLLQVFEVFSCVFFQRLPSWYLGNSEVGMYNVHFTSFILSAFKTISQKLFIIISPKEIFNYVCLAQVGCLDIITEEVTPLIAAEMPL